MSEEKLPGRLMDLREERMWTQGELSEHSGVSPATINKIENDHIERPRFSTVRKLARALEVSPGELWIGREGQAKPPKAPAQPSEAGTETALTRERTRHYRALAEQAEIGSAYWESRLGDENGISNDEVYSLLSLSRPFTNALEESTNAELRYLREQYPDDEDLRYRSVLEPARFRWVGVVLRVARLRIFDYPDNPEARQMFREFREWTEALDKEYA